MSSQAPPPGHQLPQGAPAGYPGGQPRPMQPGVPGANRGPPGPPPGQAPLQQPRLGGPSAPPPGWHGARPTGPPPGATSTAPRYGPPGVGPTTGPPGARGPPGPPPAVRPMSSQAAPQGGPRAPPPGAYSRTSAPPGSSPAGPPPGVQARPARPPGPLGAPPSSTVSLRPPGPPPPAPPSALAASQPPLATAAPFSQQPHAVQAPPGHNPLQVTPPLAASRSGPPQFAPPQSFQPPQSNGPQASYHPPSLPPAAVAFGGQAVSQPGGYQQPAPVLAAHMGQLSMASVPPGPPPLAGAPRPPTATPPAAGPPVPAWQQRRVYPDAYGSAAAGGAQSLVPPPPPIGGGPQAVPGGMPQAAMQAPQPQPQPSPISRIDPNQIPRPQPPSSALLFETRVNGAANLPPSATAQFVVKDSGNCSPRFMRSTLHQLPCSADLLSTSAMPLAVMVQPMALQDPSEEPIQVVDFQESGPVRCGRCKAYINPFMKFVDQGRRFICNLCGFTNETPRDYLCNLGPDGRRRDAEERPELCRGTVEFVAPKEYMVRDPMPAVYFFLVDVSLNAISTGATAAACSAIQRALSDLTAGERTFVGFATYNSTIHFYNLNPRLQQPTMLVVPDVLDVYTPLPSDLVVKLSEAKERLEQLVEGIPAMFESTRISDSAFGAALQGAYLALKASGGRVLAFQSVLPSLGVGSLASREAEGRSGTTVGDKELHKMLQPADKVLKTMAMEFADFQVAVDIFLTTQGYVDVASLAAIPRTTGGQLYYYHPFSAQSDSAKLYNDLRWNLMRPTALEAVMKVRCSTGLTVGDYFGNFHRRLPAEIYLPSIDCDKSVMVTFKHDDKLPDNSEACFQAALLYTSTSGERRVRVHTLALPTTTVLSNLFRAADLDAQFAYLLKHATAEAPLHPLQTVRDAAIQQCVSILYTYRKFCATASSSGQLILPEALKLLPLYTLALNKSPGLRNDAKIDERAYWLARAHFLSPSLTVPLVYPRMFAIHTLLSQEGEAGAEGPSSRELPPSIGLSSEKLEQDGIFLLENGEDAFLWLGMGAPQELVQQLLGVQAAEAIQTGPFVLQEFDNVASKRVNEALNTIRAQRCSYLRLRLLKRGDPSENLFFQHLVEDRGQTGMSYVEFLVYVHRQIQNKMG